jgi:hypothetical protein
MLLHQTPQLQNHELLLMRFPSKRLESSWIPNHPLELFICSILLLLLLLLRCYYCCFFSAQLLLAGSLSDPNISF